MNFWNDPRRAQIEPMHDFLTTWGRWERFKPTRNVSPTYRVMCWIRDHSHEIQKIREGIVTGETVHYRDSDETCEKVSLKVNFYLSKMRQAGYVTEVEQLRFYYLKCSPEMTISRIAKRLGCTVRKVDDTIKDALYLFSKFWKD